MKPRPLLLAAALLFGGLAAHAQVTLDTPVVAANAAFGQTATASTNASGAEGLLAITPWNDSIGTATIGTSGVVFNTTETFTRLCIDETQQRSIAAFFLASPSQTTANTVATWSATNPGANTFYLVVIPVQNVATVGTALCSSAASSLSRQRN